LIGQTMRAPRRPRTWRSYIPGLARLLYRNNRWAYLRLPTANSHGRTDDHARFCNISLFKPSCMRSSCSPGDGKPTASFPSRTVRKGAMAVTAGDPVKQLNGTKRVTRHLLVLLHGR
jgi:hypothetical protein